MKSAVNEAAEKLGGIDILVNNAGQGNANRFEDMTNEVVDSDFGVKVKGAIFMTRYALPYLKQSDCGAICNITTAAGKAAPGGAQPTSLSRAAGISLTKAWSKEFGEHGIRVNTVCIGSIKSRQNRRHWEVAAAKDPSYTLEDHWASYGPGIPLGRVGEAEEAGDVIAFLCSPGRELCFRDIGEYRRWCRTCLLSVETRQLQFSLKNSASERIDAVRHQERKLAIWILD